MLQHRLLFLKNPPQNTIFLIQLYKVIIIIIIMNSFNDALIKIMRYIGKINLFKENHLVAQ